MKIIYQNNLFYKGNNKFYQFWKNVIRMSFKLHMVVYGWGCNLEKWNRLSEW